MTIFLVGNAYAGCDERIVIGYTKNSTGLKKERVELFECGNGYSGGYGFTFKNGTKIYTWTEWGVDGKISNTKSTPLNINDRKPIIASVPHGVPKDFNCYKDPKKKNITYCVPRAG